MNKLSALLTPLWLLSCAHPRSTDAAGENVASERATIVEVTQGRLQGTVVGKTHMFLGVPYAEPPVGPLRFRPPRPARAWHGTKLANTLGSACPQPCGSFSARWPQNEDCLSLNVYAPRAAKKAPVMVFIHGGSFVSGFGARYDGRPLSEAGGVVVVTINYRLGALGLLALPELDAQRDGVPSGNDALRDQQLALTWVKTNIRAFGGDPDNVTVFGESAGSTSSCIHLVSPLSRGLAKRFVLESGVCDASWTTASVEDAQEVGTRLVKKFCADVPDIVSCLRALQPHELVKFRATESIFKFGFGPVVNARDPLLPQAPRDILAAGNYDRRADILVGSNARELGLFETEVEPVKSADALDDKIDSVIDSAAAAAAVKQHYRPADDVAAKETWIRLGTDLLFRCPTRAFARRTSRHGNTVYLYHFEEGKALHAHELPYVFGVPDSELGAQTLVEPLRAYVQTAFTGFARSAVPIPTAQEAGLPPWPRYFPEGDRHIALKPDVTASAGLSNLDCDFLKEIKLVQ